MGPGPSGAFLTATAAAMQGGGLKPAPEGRTLARGPRFREPDMPPDSSTLIFDADDTLWENNIYYDRVTDAFCALMARRGVAEAAARERLDAVERKNTPVKGYGTWKFFESLIESYRSLVDGSARVEDEEELRAAMEIVFDPPMVLLPGVRETLEALRPGRTFVLFTKGVPEEQNRKIDRSGLRGMFDHVRIPPEKHERAYRALVAEIGADPACTWMIGNSPRSDINPAVAAGLRAVYIPHPCTWILEKEEVPEHPAVVRLGAFSELAGVFGPAGTRGPAP
jgi:putative hydrolase of the HAD superfamily